MKAQEHELRGGFCWGDVGRVFDSRRLITRRISDLQWCGDYDGARFVWRLR